MSIEEIFTKLAIHMKEGIQFHDEATICYDFIGIRTFAKEQQKHYIEESQTYRSLLHYYSTHYHKLLKLAPVPEHQLIPESWYKYDTFQVDTPTKQKTIREITNKWIAWERATKQLYQEMYCEASAIKEIASEFYISKLIKDVTKELKEAEQLLIDLESIGYDMPTILTGW